MMKRNCTATSNSWFLFFVTESECSQVSYHSLSEDIDAELITTISISEEDSPEQGDSPESADEESEGFAERGVDPARTVVDPARTIVDPARTRGVDPARTRGEEEKPSTK